MPGNGVVLVNLPLIRTAGKIEPRKTRDIDQIIRFRGRLQKRGLRFAPLLRGVAEVRQRTFTRTRDDLELLECAALLHEAGYGINAKNTSLAAYDLIKQSYFYGLDEAETALIAEIAQYGDLHRPSPGTLILSDKQKLLADKLAAILNLANTLDESRKGKIGEVKVRLEEERLVVTAKARAELLLEQWAFDDCAPFFEDVFGIEPVLIVKSGLM